MRGPVLATVNSLPVSVNPNRGLNCFWEMPFRKHCRITIENIATRSRGPVSIRSTTRSRTCRRTRRTSTPSSAALIRCPYLQPYTILDGVKGRGHYVGTAHGRGASTTMAGGARARSSSTSTATSEFPTICGTGTEDYFGGSYDWEVDGQYVTYTTPFLGMHTVIRPDGLYQLAASPRHVPLARDGPDSVQVGT